MNGLDKHVLLSSADLLAQDKTIWLCTILSTYGSAPRPVGSLFATDGKIRLGSISGGCIEDAFLTLINHNQLDNNITIFDYGSHLAPDGSQYELPCGGHIKLLIEKITPVDQAIVHQWLSHINQDSDYIRAVHIESGERRYFQDTINIALDDSWAICKFQQKWQLLLLGISQVSEEIARLGDRAGFKVRLCDMREDYQVSWGGDKDHGGVDVEWRSPDLFVDQYVDNKTAVLALAHDPRIDDLGMMSALESNAFYIGALGSTKNSERRRERLHRIGEFSYDELSRLRAPIGLPIGSRTPFEIAIAVIADIIAVKNGISLTV
ncbi:XdhC family protein [Photobacterium damselae]|uniref:XdhC family protein n=1 Tax=Photobacterium damselae TaxID=38293 RepID=UPI001EE1306A|nr:XdhC family protein [Photobacterium damselae]MCG3811925.1 XdhC family protein [Photobacterium damselae]